MEASGIDRLVSLLDKRCLEQLDRGLGNRELSSFGET